MTQDLMDVKFSIYCSGIYEGMIRFTTEGIVHAKVDRRRRTQMNETKLSAQFVTNLPLDTLANRLNEYATAPWSQASEDVTLSCGVVYRKHSQYQAQMDNANVVSQVWALRSETALDVVTVDNRVVAFVAPHRSGMDVLVRHGYEPLTPLVVYDDERLSQPVYGVNDLGTFLVAMRDGVKLATDVYLPEGISEHERVPTILVRTCYDRNGKKDIFMRWANRGYAVVNQDVRGRSDSDGELVPFYYERDDGSDTIDWIVEQPWCNGNVGMWGASYLGYVVVAAATSGHPNLKAVVDEVNVGSPFVDTVRRGGTVCSWPLLSWTLAQSVGTRTDFDIFGGITVDVEEAVDARPIRDIPQQIIHRNSGPWDIWSQHPEYDDFWRNCTLTQRGHQISAPTFVISGWFDGDSPGVSETWQMLTEHDVAHRKIWLGPWEHNPNRARDYLTLNFSNDAVVYNYDVQVLRWFDRFLKEFHNGIDEEPRCTYYVMGDNQWQTSADWTPVEALITPLYLDSQGAANSSYGDGVLTWTCPDGGGEDSFTYNPENSFSDSGEREPENLRNQELRHDILVYTGPELTKTLTVAGELSAVLYASSTGRDTDWIVTLSDVYPNGDSIRLSNYIVRAKYRKGYDTPELLEPGVVEKYNIFLQNIAHTFAPGHRLRVSITSSSKYLAFPNLNTGNNPYEDTEAVVVTQRICHGAASPSHINLPVLRNKDPRDCSDKHK